MKIECVSCGRPVADTGYLCHSDNNNCTALTAGHLAFIAANAAELEVAITRLDRRSGGTAGGHRTETPLPFNPSASDIAREIRTVILGLAMDVAKTRGLDLDLDPLRRPLTRYPIDSPERLAAAARYLKGHLRWIRAQGHAAGPEGEPFAGYAYRAIDEAARALARATDNRPALIDLGYCGNEGCDGRLLAAHGARYAKCQECGWVASVAETVDLLMDYARDQLCTVTEIARLLSKRRRDGRSIPRGTVGAWASRGLLPRKRREGGAWLYLLGDAIDLADNLLPTDADQEKQAV